MQPECWSPVLARAYLEMGEEDRAHAILEKGIAAARQRNHCLYLVDALRVLAFAARRREQWDKARRALEELLSLARPMPYPYAEARALYEYGALYQVQRKPQLAREKLEGALAIFRRLGARPFVERTEQALAELEQ